MINRTIRVTPTTAAGVTPHLWDALSLANAFGAWQDEQERERRAA